MGNTENKQISRKDFIKGVGASVAGEGNVKSIRQVEAESLRKIL